MSKDKKKKNSFSYKFYSKNMVKIAEDKVNLLGVDNKYDVADLLNSRLLLTILSFFLILYFVDFGYFIAPVVSFLIYQLYFPLFVDSKIKKTLYNFSLVKYNNQCKINLPRKSVGRRNLK